MKNHAYEEKTYLFDNLKDFRYQADPISYWSWSNFACTSTRQTMKWNALNNSHADYLRAEAYAGDVDFAIIGKHYAHISAMGAIEWCWPSQGRTRWSISIEMRFIYPDCQSQNVVELWQDDTLLWRRGFSVSLPVADCLFLDVDACGGEIRLLVLNESGDIAHSQFVYRLKLSTDNNSNQAQILMPKKNQMFAGLEQLPPNLQRKLYEKEYPTHHLAPDERKALQQAVTVKAMHELNLAERIFGESGFFRLK